ncbi:unnamed protein product [Rotaria sp. Silwood2]|nr:unnamed protein product [Rotaria sp. Silwood2]CAF4450934.1 unnamed protein product [Rotaria sp. Silwood2]CAF4494122.1 unnamed protein product [Rotaria sp. Silwood2]
MNILIKPHQQNNLLNELMDQTYDKEEEHYKIEKTILKQLDDEKLLTTKSNKKFSNHIADIIVELEHHRYRRIV